MRRSRKPILIASRRSTLARVQAERVGQALARRHPNLTVEHIWIESEGDRDLNASLADRGGKGLFTRELERVLLDGKADVVVHSLKDLPVETTAGLSIAAIPRRADVRDCLVTRHDLVRIEELPQDATVGTSSPRRAAQVLRIRPDLRIEPMRGNVDTRVAKALEAGKVDATLLAVAGLVRMGLVQHTEHKIEVEQVMPAAAQGALAIQCRTNDHVTLTRCLPLNHAATATAVHTERHVIGALGASCHSSIGVLAEPVVIDPKSVKRNADAHWFRLRVRVLSGDGAKVLEADEQIKTKDLRLLVARVVRSLKEQGAEALLADRLPQPQAQSVG